ncbi:MAG: transposase family protein [Nitrososphaeria archaeon]
MKNMRGRGLSQKPRKNRVGAGRPFKLSLRDRLLMLFVYYRLYITSTLTSYLFDLNQSNVLKDIRKLEPLVREVMPIPEKVYAATRRANTPEEVEKYFPDFKAFIDATEQEIPRPRRSDKRKTHYSGKKKRHTVKTQITVKGWSHNSQG